MDFVKYIVKPEENMVVGIINRKELFSAAGKLMDRLPAKYEQIVRTMHNNLFKDVDNAEDPAFKAIATCQEPDEFSERIGKDIVDKKLSYKYHTSMVKKFEQIQAHLEVIIDKCKELKREHEAYVEMFDEQLKKYM